jgi:polygalacturonase
VIARWIDGALEVRPENTEERDALLTMWNLRKDYRRPVSPDDFGVQADGVSDDTAAIQAVIDATVSL